MRGKGVKAGLSDLSVWTDRWMDREVDKYDGKEYVEKESTVM